MDELTIRRERSRPGSTHTGSRYDERTKAQKAFDFIVAYKREHDGNSPTMREIMVGCQISSTSMVSFYLDQLEAMGFIRRPEREMGNFSAANIEVVGGEWSFPAGGSHE
jgi:SOS-response transcriptional repressor LexA